VNWLAVRHVPGVDRLGMQYGAEKLHCNDCAQEIISQKVLSLSIPLSSFDK
jgi:hypothetical protein